jgi:hypothetical protein
MTHGERAREGTREGKRKKKMEKKKEKKKCPTQGEVMKAARRSCSTTTVVDLVPVLEVDSRGGKAVSSSSRVAADGWIDKLPVIAPS